MKSSNGHSTVSSTQSTGLLIAQTLEINHFVIPTLLAGEFLVIAALDYLALVEHVDDVGFLDRTQPVRNSDCGSPTSSIVQGCLDNFLGFGVKS